MSLSIAGWLLLCEAVLALPLLRAIIHRRTIRTLRPLPLSGPWPAVTVFVPARNEEESIGPALRSLLAQDYPGEFRIVAIDDNSTDRTDARIRAVARRDSRRRLSIVKPSQPPPGWMGKCHALHCGLAEALPQSEYFLFTDADVIHGPSMLRCGVALLRRRRGGLLFCMPRLDMETFWERVVLSCGILGMYVSLDPRAIESKEHPQFMGAGAFNLLRRDVYERIGGHAAIRNEILDDVALGMRTKALGERVLMARTGWRLHLRMYRGLRAIVDGFTKNSGVAIQSFPRGVAVTMGQLAFALLPFAALPIATSTEVMATALAMWLFIGATIASIVRSDTTAAPVWVIFGWPLGFCVLAWITLRSAWHTYIRKEVEWRGRRLPVGRQTVKMRL